jgi:hypothetical protein
MSLEGAQASLKDREHGLRFFRGLTFVDRGLNDDALPGDAFLSCGNVPISLGKMLSTDPKMKTALLGSST